MSKEALEELLKTLPAEEWYPDFRDDSVWMKCPNPDHMQTGRSPPFKITTEEGQYFGRFHCFGCGIDGPLRSKDGVPGTLELLGLRAGSGLRVDRAHDVFKAEEVAEMRGGNQKKISKPVTEEWPASSKWRGISGRLVRDVGGRMQVAGDGRDPLLILPVNMRGVERGYVKCRVFPKKDGFDYVNVGGTKWSKDSLFPYDYVSNMLDNTDGPRILVGVEGSRDALQTIQNGAAALATLGATSWSTKCAEAIRVLSPDVFVCMADPDEAGDILERKMYNSLHRFMTVKVVRLPSKVVETAQGPKKVKLVDPADLSRGALKKILTKIEAWPKPR